MQIAERHRWVVVWQWVLAIVMPAFVILGRALLGAELGWMAVVGIVVYATPTIIALLIPPLLTRFDGGARDARTVRRGYALACYVMWGGLFVAGLTIPDSGDNGHLPSVVSRWFGVSYDASEIMFYIAFMVAVIAWALSLAVAVSGIVVSRRTAR